MKRILILAVAGAVLMGASPAFAKKRHMEKQCQWKNYKKVCVMVKVCR
jgi:hypothetical protein